jgi:hypothetical protein
MRNTYILAPMSLFRPQSDIGSQSDVVEDIHELLRTRSVDVYKIKSKLLTLPRVLGVVRNLKATHSPPLD